MIVWVAVLLGVVQGVFMFVPVSSTSHLALVQHLLQGWGVDIPDPESAEMILFDIVLHVGTLVSIAVVLRRRLVAIALDAVGELRRCRREVSERPGLRTLALLGVSTAVTGVLGLGVRAVSPTLFGEPRVIGVMLIITGVILWWTDRARPAGVVRPTILMAVGIGVAQAAALTPGLSRSGLTIAAALALGMRRDQAAEYSFILAIPTISAAALVQGADVFGSGGLTIPLSAYATGFVVAAAVGVVSLIAVLKLLYAARFRVFSVYVWALAAVVIVSGVA
ncbi:MAG: undecaprenyl-diphosphate phosphatase [Acidimicrobiales bacterium]